MTLPEGQVEVARVLELIRARIDQVHRPLEPVGRWKSSLGRAFPDFALVDWGDGFQYSKCHSYEIDLHGKRDPPRDSMEDELARIRAQGGERWFLLLKISAVAPFFILRLMRRRLSKGAIVEEVDEPRNAAQREAFARALAWCRDQGLERLPDEILAVAVPEVTLEQVPPGQTTIYNCLFEDEEPL